ncbi:hypothetical protein [Mycolicibacterium hippocampi]|uniref:hypothetical protein n=1 Tax=Mycobacteriaceae TaxID=1762 RepID=UPI0015B5BD7B|nr:hypothetical protein [Mycolicibacterium hippocampi]
MASPAVQLAAIPSPLQLYPQVLVKSLTNVGGLFEQYFADPFPIIRATLANQAVAFEDALTSLQFGRLDEFFVAVADFVLQPLKSIGQGIGTVFSYFDLLVSQPGGREYLFNVAFSPLLNGIAATGLAIADVFEAITTFDVIGLVNAVINIPARIIDGVLNGVPGAEFDHYPIPGLLTTEETSPAPGLISFAIFLDQSAGEAIAPEAPAAIDEWPGPEVQATMLTTEPETEPVAVQEQLPTEDEAVLEEQDPLTEELDLPTSDVLGQDVPEEEVLGEDVPGDELPGEEVDDLVEEEEPAPAQEQSPPDPDLADDDEQSSPAPTDEANDPGTEAND